MYMAESRSQSFFGFSDCRIGQSYDFYARKCVVGICFHGDFISLQAEIRKGFGFENFGHWFIWKIKLLFIFYLCGAFLNLLLSLPSSTIAGQAPVSKRSSSLYKLLQKYNLYF